MHTGAPAPPAEAIHDPDIPAGPDPWLDNLKQYEYRPQRSPLPNAGGDDPYDKVASACLESYRTTRSQYQSLVKVTRQECEDLLARLKIKGMVSGRAKDYSSLERKLTDPEKNAEIREWLFPTVRPLNAQPLQNVHMDDNAGAIHGCGGSGESDATPHPAPATENDPIPGDVKDLLDHKDMGDLAGLRIGVYFPDEMVIVAKEVEKNFDLVHPFGTVTGWRNYGQDDNKVLEEHVNGPFRSPDNPSEHWEHSGYKSWQLVVKWKPAMVEARARQCEADNGRSEGQCRERQTCPFHGLRVFTFEIQIGSVVSQAWAEIQHNITYKRPLDIVTTPGMKRMIDGINGLAITTDIMLKELGQSLSSARTESRRCFKRPIEFLDWFKRAYVHPMRPEMRQRWLRGCHEASAQQLFWISQSPLCEPKMKKNWNPCPAFFTGLLNVSRLIDRQTGSAREYDISILVAELLGFGFYYKNESRAFEWNHSAGVGICRLPAPEGCTLVKPNYSMPRFYAWDFPRPSAQQLQVFREQAEGEEKANEERLRRARAKEVAEMIAKSEERERERRQNPTAEDLARWALEAEIEDAGDEMNSILNGS